MQMDAGMDTGAILAQTPLPIDKSETGGTLTGTPGALGAALLTQTLPAFS
jgi:methionyl-tRNA formyltransferase